MVVEGLDRRVVVGGRCVRLMEGFSRVMRKRGWRDEERVTFV